MRVRAFGIIFAVVAGLAGSLSAQNLNCRQALALGLDVSGSVNVREYRLQLEGLAAALLDPAVSKVILEAPEVPISIAVYEWAGRYHQRLVLPWRSIVDRETLDQIAFEIQNWQRGRWSAETGLGAALVYGADLLRNGPECLKSTLDISGDGENNDWPRPVDVYSWGDLEGITVNALVIGQRYDDGQGNITSNISQLTAYFKNVVIGGPGAFTEPVIGFDGFAEAMKRKLLREIATLAVGTYRP